MAGRNVFAAVRSYLQPGAGPLRRLLLAFAKNAKNESLESTSRGSTHCTFCKGLRSLFAAAEGPRSASDQLPPSMPYTSTSPALKPAEEEGLPQDACRRARLPQDENQPFPSSPSSDSPSELALYS